MQYYFSEACFDVTFSVDLLITHRFECIALQQYYQARPCHLLKATKAYGNGEKPGSKQCCLQLGAGNSSNWMLLLKCGYHQGRSRQQASPKRLCNTVLQLTSTTSLPTYAWISSVLALSRVRAGAHERKVVLHATGRV